MFQDNKNLENMKNTHLKCIILSSLKMETFIFICNYIIT